MRSKLEQAAIDDAYKSGIVDAEQAAMNAIYARFATRPSDSALCDGLMHLVGQAIHDAMISRHGADRMAAVSNRAILSPHDGRGNPILQ